MAKIFIINDTSITAGVDSTSDVGSSSVKWVNGFFSGLVTVGTLSGNIIAATVTAGTVSASGAIIGGTTLTIGTVSATGQLISASTAGVVGQLAALVYTFSTSSALQVTSIPVPFAGSIDKCYVTTGSVSAVVAAYTLRVGSAGSVAVATVSNTTASQGVQELLTTAVTTFAITNALVATRSVQGTGGDTSICIVVRKTV